MAKNDFQYGGWDSYTLQCGTIMTLISPGECTLQCGRYGSGMTCHWIFQNVRHIGILHLVSVSTRSPQSTCHSAPVSEILSKSDHPQSISLIADLRPEGRIARKKWRQKKMTSCRFSRSRISAILDFRDPVKKPSYITFYRSSMDTIALNCLVFEKIAFLAFWRRRD